MAFTRSWTSAYQALPADSEEAKLGASRIREVKVDIAQRMIVDHHWAGDDHDGKHKRISLRALTADPSTNSQEGYLYIKDSGGALELFYKDSKGQVFQMTSANGGLANILLPGFIIGVGNTAIADGVSYIQCDGRAISRTNFVGLFSAIGVLWGGGDGVTTFNVPDLRGRALIGAGQGTNLTNRVTAQLVGTETHKLTIQEIPGHAHNWDVVGDRVGTPAITNVLQVVNGPASHFTSGYTAGGDPGTGVANNHQNMQPSAVVNWWIKT